MNLNADLDKFLKRTLWLWLPFYALMALIRDIRGKSKHWDVRYGKAIKETHGFYTWSDAFLLDGHYLFVFISSRIREFLRSTPLVCPGKKRSTCCGICSFDDACFPVFSCLFYISWIMAEYFSDFNDVRFHVGNTRWITSSLCLWSRESFIWCGYWCFWFDSSLWCDLEYFFFSIAQEIQKNAIMNIRMKNEQQNICVLPPNS